MCAPDSLTLYVSMNWRDLSYLKSGTPRQRAAFTLLADEQVLNLLAPYDPVLVSTVCLDLDTPTSDLDIICHVTEAGEFERCLRSHFGNKRDFVFRIRDDAHRSMVCAYTTDQFEIEIFGSLIPVEQQPAYRHLVVTERLLSLSGQWLRNAIRDQKHSGLKTEPAISRILGLHGDPYEQVLILERESEETLQKLLNEAYDKHGTGT